MLSDGGPHWVLQYSELLLLLVIQCSTQYMLLVTGMIDNFTFENFPGVCWFFWLFMEMVNAFHQWYFSINYNNFLLWYLLVIFRLCIADFVNICGDSCTTTAKLGGSSNISETVNLTTFVNLLCMSCAAWHSVGLDFAVYKPWPICGSELLPLLLFNKEQHGQKGL